VNILITGASKGIGRALVTEILKHSSQYSKIICVARDQNALKELQREFGQQIVPVIADVSSEKDLQHIVDQVKTLNSLDLLINNAGVLKKDYSEKDFTESFQVNAIAPFLLTRALLPYLNHGKNPQVVQISTLMSSIEDNGSGGYYAYRSSKAALNMITKSLSIDHPKIKFLLIHPGWVKTEMGGEQAPLSPETSAQGIWKVIKNQQQDESGIFKDYRGNTLPW
jgi:NAD(P)-dependent dehydrogenase (short-subunit alcohol dehydrogenase family)